MTDPHLLAALHQVAQVLVVAGADSEAAIVEKAIERIKELMVQVYQRKESLERLVAVQREALRRIAYQSTKSTLADVCWEAHETLKALADAAEEEDVK